MSFRLLLDIVRARYFLILLTFAVTVAVAGFLTFTEPKRYVASTSLVLNLEKDTPFESIAMSSQQSSSYLATQLDIIRSQKVAMKVVEQLKLDADPAWREYYAASGDGVVPIKPWIAAQIMANVAAEPLPNSSRVVNISYKALAPTDAATMANAYAQAYIATALELTVEPARRNAAWFDQQLKGLRQRLESARSRMSELQSEKGIVALDEKLGAETSRLDDITRNLVEAQMATANARSRQLGVNHPEYRAAVQREGALMAALNAQKRNILQLQRQRDELDTLAREVQTEQDNYAATLQSYYRTAMESRFTQTNIAVLSPAFPPAQPSSPNVPLNMIGAIVLGLFLGMVAAVIAEMVSPRERTVRVQRRFVGEPLSDVTPYAA